LLGQPFFTFIYFIPFFGYGLISLILYSIGKMPGSEGKHRFNFKSIVEKFSWRQFFFGLYIAIIVTVLAILLLKSIIYNVFPTNIRILWLFIFTILCSIGFYYIRIESNMIRNSEEKVHLRLFINYLILLVPFVIGVAVIGLSGTLIYFFDGLHSLAIIVFVILMGELLDLIWKKPLFAAIFQSFLLFFLVLPRGPMTIFSLF
ncbi:MAG: hypothetical protein ACFFDW_12035, partial [Candidatus Thorarchaeota archaeon]